MTLTQILEGIADFFTGSSSSSDGATVELDNLGTTSINKPLIFDLSVNAGAASNTVSISQSNDDLYLKAPSDDIIYQQINGITIAEARSDQFKISKNYCSVIALCLATLRLELVFPIMDCI